MAIAASVVGATKQRPRWVEPFMAHDITWWEVNGHHFPKDWGAAEGGVDWTPSPNNSSNPITALLGGTVVGAGYFCKDGSSNQFCRSYYGNCGGAQGYGVVTIRSNNPYPNLVPGALIDIYYQHIIIDNSIHLPQCTGGIGQVVQAGDVIGYPNGDFNIEVGVNVGTQWGTIWGHNSPGPHVDPIPFLYQLIGSGATGTVYTGSTGIGNVGTAILAIRDAGFTNTITTVSNQAHNLMVDVGGFLSICEALDIVEQFVPFTLPTQVAQDINTVNQPQTFQVFGWDTGIINPSAVANTTQAAVELPADAIQAILVFTVTNFAAFAIRSLFVIAGLILFYALIINLGSEILDVKGTAQTVEKVAPLFM